jgi:hypothetical protein
LKLVELFAECIVLNNFRALRSIFVNYSCIGWTFDLNWPELFASHLHQLRLKLFMTLAGHFGNPNLSLSLTALCTQLRACLCLV